MAGSHPTSGGVSMKILVTGVTGQDGHALAEQCLAAGHTVFGLVRWVSADRKPTLLQELPGIQLIDGDLIDAESLNQALKKSDPDVVYNLAALASSGQSWAQPMIMGEINAIGVLKLLEAIRRHNPAIRFVQASTSEQYGRVNELPQSELTPFGSLNIYGVAKTFAHQATINYRDSYNMHASTALMHNHVSLRRNPYFVDRKITRTVARIAKGLDSQLMLGNTDAARDWGWGPEYMQAWQLISAHSEPGDYIIATGESHTVAELIETAFALVGMDPEEYVKTDPSLFRPTDVAELRGDPSYIAKTLGWSARIKFHEIVRLMMQNELSDWQLHA